MTSSNEPSSDDDDPPLQNLSDTIVKVKKAFGFKTESEISQTSVKEINIDLDEHKKLEFSEKSKILVIENCNTIQHFLEISKDEHFSNFLKNSPNYFVLIVNTKKKGLIDFSNFLDVFDGNFIFSRPYVIQLNIIKGKKSKIFFKRSSNIQFSSFEFDEDNIKEKYFVNQICEGNFHFDLLLKALTSGICGSFDGNILTCSLETDTKYDGMTLMEHAIGKNDELILRFLKLFTNEIDSKLLEKAIKASNIETLRAFLDLPVVEMREEVRIDDTLIEMLSSKHGNGKSFLCLAAESGEPEVVEFLVDLNLFNKTFDEALQASNCAFDKQNFRNLMVLLKNDFPFPTNFDVAWKTCEDFHFKQELESIKNNRKALHDGIKTKNKQIVEKFIEENAEIQIGFSPSNKTALRVALEVAVESNDFRIYAFLLYNRFSAGDDVEYQSLFNSLSNKQKETITITCQSFYGRPFDSHIFFIYSRTRLGLGYDKSKQKSHFEKIKGYLDRLNQITDIVPILKVIEYSYTLIIVFDFDRDSVEKIDLLSSKTTLGICYPNSGRIYIGAKTSDSEVVSTMIHELSHYAMKIIFENGGKPFYANDLDSEKMFMEIVNYYQKLNENIVIVQRVFDCYNPKSYCDELIVRVPEMTAFYHENPPYLTVLKKVYSKLFTFYHEKVGKQIIKFIEDPAKLKSVREVQQINERLGNMRAFVDIKLKPVEFNRVNNEVPKSKSLEVFVSEIPKFTVASIMEKMRIEKKSLSGSTIVLTSRDLENESVVQNILSTCLMTDEIKLIINCESLTELPKIFLKLLKCEQLSGKVFLICEENFELEKLKNTFPNISINRHKVKYTWSDLSDELKNEVLESKVQFQNRDILLGNILKSSDKSAEFLPLPLLMKKVFVKIGSDIQISEGYDLQFFIHRNFSNLKLSTEKENFENFMKHVENEKIVLISDEAGMGKSTILSHIALKLKVNYRGNWVVRIDLHKHVEAFKAGEDEEYEFKSDSDSDSEVSDCSDDNESENDEDSSGEKSKKSLLISEGKINKESEKFSEIHSFISHHLAKTCSDFEHQLFSELFEQGKVILLLDGLDEISPFCDKEFNRFLNQLKSSPVKQVWITTRPNLRKELEKNTSKIAWELKPFSKENQVDFVTKYWTNKLKSKISSKIINHLKYSAEELIRHVSESIEDDSLNLIGIPLQARMIADIFFDDVKRNLKRETVIFRMPDNFTILWLYKEFMTRKIVIATEEKGRQILTEKARNEVDGIDMMKIHEKLAVNLILVKGKSDVVNLDKIEPNPKHYEINIDQDKLQRYGVVSIDFNGKAFFIHRTFAEYFVAMFIFKVLLKSKMRLLKEVTKLIVLLESRAHYTIRTFIECSIKESTSVQGNKKVQKKIAKCIEHQLKLKDFDFLRHFACSNKTFFVSFLLHCVNFCGKSYAIASLQGRKEESILHVSAAKGNKALFEETWKIVETKMEKTEIKSLFMTKDYSDMNIFVLAYHRVFTCHADFVQECLSYDQLKSRENVEVSYEYYRKHSLLMRIFSIAKEILNDEEMSELVPEMYMLGKVFYQFNGTSDEYRLSPMTSEFAEKYLRFVLNIRFEIVKVMKTVGSDEDLMTEENIFTQFLTFFIDQKRKVDGDGRILELFKWIQERFPSKRVMQYCADKYLMKALLKIAHKETAEKIIKIVKTYVTDDEFSDEFVLKSDSFYPVEVYSFDSFLKPVIKILSEVFTTRELKNVFLNCNNFDERKLMNILATKHNSTKKTLKLVLNVMKNKFTSHEIFKIFEASSYNGKLLTDLFAEHTPKEKFSIYLEFIEQTLSEENQKQLVPYVSVRNCIFVKNCSETLEILSKFIGDLYKESEVVKLLKSEESLFFYAPTKQGNEKTFELLTTFASRFLDEESLNKVLLNAQPPEENLRKFSHFIS